MGWDLEGSESGWKGLKFGVFKQDKLEISLENICLLNKSLLRGLKL